MPDDSDFVVPSYAAGVANESDIVARCFLLLDELAVLSLVAVHEVNCAPLLVGLRLESLHACSQLLAVGTRVRIHEAVGDLSGRQRLIKTPVLLDRHPGVPVALVVRCQGLAAEGPLEFSLDGASEELAGDVDQVSRGPANRLVFALGPLEQVDQPVSALGLREGRDVALDDLQVVVFRVVLGFYHRVDDVVGQVLDPLGAHTSVEVVGCLQSG